MNIIELYEDLKKYIKEPTKYDDLFYDAPEGEAQIDIMEEILNDILARL